MRLNQQDGRASIPRGLRVGILWFLGGEWVAVLDRYGAKHDLEIGSFGYILAAIFMALRLFIFPLLFLLFVSIFVSLGVFAYAILPQCVKDLWWRWFDTSGE